MVFIPRWEKYKDKKPTGLVEINYGHELSTGLVTAIFPQDYRLVDLTNDSELTGIGKSVDYLTRFSEASRTDASLAGYHIFPVKTESARSLTVAHAAKLYSGSSAEILLRDATVTGGYIFGWRNASKWDMRVGATDYTNNGTFNLDTEYLYVASCSSTFSRLYVDSKLVISGAAGGTQQPNTEWYIHRNGTNAQYANASTAFVLIWDVAKSQDEVVSFSEYPYQILKPRKTFFVLTQSSGVTASVTGASVSLSAGTLSASITEQLTGAGLMATAGSSVSAIDHSLSGESIALAQGLVQGIIEALLTGQTLTGQSGLLQSAINQALTGQLISAEADTVTSTAAYSLTGQPISSDLDNITSAIDQALTGQPISSDLDNITNAIDQALTGQSATTNISALSEAIAHSLTGQSINMVAGFVELIGNVVRGLTGEPLSVAQTTLTYDLTQNLLGGSVTTSSGVVEVSVNQGLTGSVIALSIGDLALQGQTARQLVGALISATSGSVQSAIEASLSGQAIALTQATIESAVSSLLTGQTITIEQGSSSVTLEKTLAGETIISGQGTIVFDSLDKSATLTGLQIQTSAGIVLVDGVRDTRLVNVIAMGNGGYVVVLDASTKVIIQDNGNKVIN